MSNGVKLAVGGVGALLLVGLVVGTLLLGWIDLTQGTVAFIFIGASVTIISAIIFAMIVVFVTTLICIFLARFFVGGGGGG